jgi:heptaprenyl diphosphate synthase
MPSTTERRPLAEPAALTRLRREVRLAWLAAFAVALHLLEAALPPVLPGIKPGLANVITVAALCLWGWRTAALVTLLRVVVGAIFLGTLLSPAFWLSLGGAGAALAAMGLGRALPGRGLGPVGYSVVAGMAHIGGQLLVAYALFIQHAGLWALAPILGLAAAVTGTVNGIAAYALVNEWEPEPPHADSLAGD